MTLDKITTLTTLGLAVMVAVVIMRRPGEGTQAASAGRSQSQDQALASIIGTKQGQWALFADASSAYYNHLYWNR